MNYNTGQLSGFAFAGVQAGWAGGASGSVYSGYVYGLNGSNSNYSGGFTSISGGAAVGGFLAASSGGMTSFGGVKPTGPPIAVGLSMGARILPGITGGVSATNYTSPLQLGRWATLANPIDFLGYVTRQICNH